MPSQPVQLVRFDPAGASDDEWQDILAGVRLTILDADPQAPERSTEERRAQLEQRFGHADMDRVVLLARVDGKLAGILLADFLRPSSTHYAQEGHTGIMQIFVLPEYRRRGIATVFLEQVVEIASRRGVAILKTPASHEEGAAFAEQIGMQALAASERISAICFEWNPSGQLFGIDVDELAAHLGL